ncbi:proline-rich antigen-like [Manis pentadactyla]|uniref:proline-rich antigen-like n=1 Tax=Manis pentadactyla TaxID=143292 RepID=UPI00255C33E4|nr:proline-rich antigen-like [Manis pentadactyla]
MSGALAREGAHLWPRGLRLGLAVAGSQPGPGETRGASRPHPPPGWNGPEPPPSPGPAAGLRRRMSRAAPGAWRAKPKPFLEENIVLLGLNLLLQEEPSCHVRD